MRNYQKLLLDALQRNHWNLDEIRKPEYWWAAELWEISSSRQQYGLRLFVTFIVDPGSGHSHDLAATREIAITRETLSDYHAVGALVSLQPQSRSYPADVDAAMTMLDEFRTTNTP